MQPNTPTLITHSGTFHCDDAFSYAVLRLALGLATPGEDHRLVRTRDAAAIEAADIVWDVGAEHDAARGRFDHHQRGAPVRENGSVPYSAAGLVWQVYGVTAVRALLSVADEGMAEAVATAIDEDVIRRLDAIDNGIAHPDDTLGLADLVADFNPAWDSGLIGDRAAEDAAFVEAAALAENFLRRRVFKVRARLAADGVVAAAYARGTEPLLLELDDKMPWQEAVFSHGLPVLYAVYPVPGGNWIVDAMPPEPGSFAQRLPLPEAWAGLRAQELAAVSGIADAVFVHAQRFVGAAGSREGAMAMALRAIALGNLSLYG
jgi:uncharacterized UPF0160 family protein